jgi:hypothetical protein
VQHSFVNRDTEKNIIHYIFLKEKQIGVFDLKIKTWGEHIIGHLYHDIWRYCDKNIRDNGHTSSGFGMNEGFRVTGRFL